MKVYRTNLHFEFNKSITNKIKFNGGLGIGDWGLGIGPNPQSPIPNPQSPSFFKFTSYFSIMTVKSSNFFTNSSPSGEIFVFIVLEFDFECNKSLS